MNNFKRMLAGSLSLMLILLAGCGSDPADDQTSAAPSANITEASATAANTEPQASEVTEEDTSSTKKAEETSPSESVKPTERATKAKNEAAAAEKPTTAANLTPIPDISNGISLLSKTSPVAKGAQASITVMGTPGKEFTVEFYENGKNDISKSADFKAKTSNSAGIVTWNFTVPSTSGLGNNMIIIKETGSKNSLQTSITVK